MNPYMSTVSAAPSRLLLKALTAARQVGLVYETTVDAEVLLTPAAEATLAAKTVKRYDRRMVPLLWRLPEGERRLVETYLLGHASHVHDDGNIRREVASYVLCTADQDHLWTGREDRSAWSRAALGQALAVRAYFRDLSGDEHDFYNPAPTDGGEVTTTRGCPLDMVIEEVALSAAGRLAPYEPFLSEWEFEEALLVACTGADEDTDKAILAAVYRHLAAAGRVLLPSPVGGAA